MCKSPGMIFELEDSGLPQQGILPISARKTTTKVNHRCLEKDSFHCAQSCVKLREKFKFMVISELELSIKLRAKNKGQILESAVPSFFGKEGEACKNSANPFIQLRNFPPCELAMNFEAHVRSL